MSGAAEDLAKAAVLPAGKKAAAAATSQKTIGKLPKSTRSALGKQANKVKREQA